MYNGLTTADKGALLDAKARGAEWVARDESTTLWGYDSKPHKFKFMGEFNTWTIDDENFVLGAIDIDDDVLRFIQWSNPEPVNIDIALAQIAEMESAEKPIHSERYYEILEEIKGWKPWQKEAFNQLAKSEHATQIDITEKQLTWNERINQMTVEEKSETFVVESSVMLDIGSGKKEYPIWITPLIDGVSFTSKEAAINYNKDHLNSPYTEGETENG